MMAWRFETLKASIAQAIKKNAVVPKETCLVHLKKKSLGPLTADDEKPSLSHTEGHSHSESLSDLHIADKKQSVYIIVI